MEKNQMKESNKKIKFKKILSNTITAILFVLLITISIFVIITRVSSNEPEIFGYQLKVVLSGSMEPTFRTGSVIAVEEYTNNSSIEVDDVITFVDESDQLITHRVVDIQQNGTHTLYQTKGDNNRTPDQALVQDDNVVATYSGMTIPYLGYIVHYMQSPLGSALLLIIPGLGLLGYGMYNVWSTIIRLERKAKNISE